LRLLYRSDLRGRDDLRGIVDAMKKMGDQSLGDPMLDARSMVLQKMDGKKGDR
jgi:hypothetical protein